MFSFVSCVSFTSFIQHDHPEIFIHVVGCVRSPSSGIAEISYWVDKSQFVVLVDIWADSILGLWWIDLMWTFPYRAFCGLGLSLPLSRNVGVKFLGSHFTFKFRGDGHGQLAWSDWLHLVNRNQEAFLVLFPFIFSACSLPASLSSNPTKVNSFKSNTTLGYDTFSGVWELYFSLQTSIL